MVPKLTRILFIVTVTASFLWGQTTTEEWLILEGDENAPTWMQTQDARGIDYNPASFWNGRNPNVTESWIVKATGEDAAAWQTTGQARGIDFNAQSTHSGNTILYADNAGNQVHVHSAADGSYLWSLDTTGVKEIFEGHTVSPYRVAVTADGQVFVNSFDGIVVKWANDAAETQPEVVIDLSEESGNSRALEAVGQGNDVRLFLGKGTDIRVFDDDGSGHFMEATNRAITTDWPNECEAIAAVDSNMVYAANGDPAQDQSVNRRVYELTESGYVNNEDKVNQLPYLAWFVCQGLDVGDGYYIMSEAGGSNDGFAVGTVDGDNYSPLMGDTDGDDIYDGGMDSPAAVTDICFDAESGMVYWTAAGADEFSGIGAIRINEYSGNTIAIADDDNNTVHIHKAANGDYLYDLSNEGLPENFWVSVVDPYRVAVTDDGQIFAHKFNGTVVRWTNDADTTKPEIVIDLSGESGSSRGLEVAGSGDAVTVYLSKGADVRVFQDDGSGNFVENNAMKINAPFADEAEGIAAQSTERVWLVNNAASARAVYDWTGTSYALNSEATAALPFQAFSAQGVDVDTTEQLYILGEGGGDLDGIAIGTTAGENYPPDPASLDSDGDGVYDASGQINSANFVVDVAIDRENNFVYWVSAGPGGGFGKLKANVPQTTTIAEVDPDSLHFGEVTVGGSAMQYVDLINLGDNMFTVDSIAFGTADFSTSINDTVVAENDTIQIPVTFTPMAEGMAKDEMIIYTPTETLRIYLSGTGYELLPLSWRVHADSASSDWFYIEGEAEDMVRGMAKNPLNNHLYVVSRVGGNYLYVLDAASGDTLKHLNTEGISEGTYEINMVAATQDGQIIVGNLAAWGGQIFRLYHYKDEFDEPTLIVDGFYEDYGVRVGDALAAVGRGDHIRIFVSGSNADKIITFETSDGSNFNRTEDIDLPEINAARYGISPVDTSGQYLFVNGPATAPRYIKDDGTVLYEFDTDKVPSGTSIEYFEIDTESGDVRRFVGITNAFSSGTSVIELLGEPGENLCSDYQMLESATERYEVNTNANATGQAVYDNINNALIELITNNGISSYSLDRVVPDAVTDVQRLATMDEGFEGADLPDGWLVFADSTEAGNPDPAWTVTDYVAHSGDQAAYMPNYNTKSRCWLVTPALDLAAENVFLNYYLKDDWNNASNDFGSQLKVLVSTASQNDPSDFTLVETYDESEFYDAWGLRNIDLSAVEGKHAYVAFMVENFGDPNDSDAGGDNWCLDDVHLSDTPTDIEQVENGLPTQYTLGQNYPNPFNPNTRFELTLPKKEDVRIEIFNVLGQRVLKLHDGLMSAGVHTFTVEGHAMSSGIYFYRVKAGQFTQTRKMVLMK